MSLEETLREKKSGKNSSEQSSNQDHEKKLKSMQYQNDLLMERQQQLTDMMEKILKTSETLHTTQEKNLQEQVTTFQTEIKQSVNELESVTMAWKCKTDELKTSNEVLADSFKKAISSEIDVEMKEIKNEINNNLVEMNNLARESMRLMKESSNGFADEAMQERETALQGFEEKYNAFLSAFEKRAAEINQAYQKEMKELEKVTHEIVEKQQRHNHIFENGKFLFSNLIMVVIAVILIRALFFGVWEGLYVNELYAWGSQWEWLKYALWSLFALIIGGIGYFAYQFIKNNINRP